MAKTTQESGSQTRSTDPTSPGTAAPVVDEARVLRLLRGISDDVSVLQVAAFVTHA